MSQLRDTYELRLLTLWQLTSKLGVRHSIVCVSLAGARCTAMWAVAQRLGIYLLLVTALRPAHGRALYKRNKHQALRAAHHSAEGDDIANHLSGMRSDAAQHMLAVQQPDLSVKSCSQWCPCM